jgi:cytochrome P450
MVAEIKRETTADEAVKESFIRDPHSLYVHMRANAPVFATNTPNGRRIWIVTRYEDGVAALNDPRLSSSVRDATDLVDKDSVEARNIASLPPALRENLLSMDGPDHTRLRALVSRAMVPARMAKLRPDIERIVDELLDRMAEHETVDLISALAFHVPTRVACVLLGMPATDSQQLSRWTQTLVSMSFASLERFAADGAALYSYIVSLAESKRANPGDDLISALIDVRNASEQITEVELMSLIGIMILGGFETTMNLIGNGTLTLLRHPEQLAALRQNPELVPGAVEELLRYNGPVHLSTFRYTMEEVRIGETTIPAGEVVMISLLSANRDDRRFADGEALDIRRGDRGHLAFGHGAHFCVGAALARLMGLVTFSKLLARFPGLRLAKPAEELTWNRSLLMRGLQSLPVHLR